MKALSDLLPLCSATCELLADFSCCHCAAFCGLREKPLRHFLTSNLSLDDHSCPVNFLDSDFVREYCSYINEDIVRERRATVFKCFDCGLTATHLRLVLLSENSEKRKMKWMTVSLLGILLYQHTVYVKRE